MVVCVRVSFQGSGVLKHCTPRATPLAFLLVRGFLQLHALQL